MADKKEFLDYRLIQISRNRYKIEIKEGAFTKAHAVKIPGCYFSGPQKRWVFPISLENRELFESMFEKPKLQTEAKKEFKPEITKEIVEFERYLKGNRYSASTIETYTSMVTKFFKHTKNKSPSEISLEDIIRYNHDFIIRKGLSASYQNQFINAIKKFYEKVHNKNLRLEEIERPRRSKHLPKVLSKEDVMALLNTVKNIKHKALLSLIYSAGLRRSELLNVKITDIDSKRMIINIRNAKGNKDRIVGLSKRILVLLQEYYRTYKPKEYLFEGQQGNSYSAESIGKVFRRAKAKAGIKTEGGVHILRHSFATHLHESGYDIRLIQEILGHKSSKTTEIYTHVSTKSIRNVKSPFDDIDA